MTVEDKRNELTKYCTGNDCFGCTLRSFCWEHNLIGYTNVQEKLIDKAYSTLMESKGDKTMNENALNVTKAEEKTITIAVSEYRFLISEQSTLSKLEGYAETHEYLSDDVVRALLGVEKPNPARIESEGD